LFTPSASVPLALQEISNAQLLLVTQTWGKLNLLAGLAAIPSVMLLAQAQWSLTTWQIANPLAQTLATDTAGIVLVHDLAEAAFQTVQQLPGAAQTSMQNAAVLIPLVGIFGVSDGGSQALSLVSQAQANSEVNGNPVYAKIPLQMNAVTEPVVYISVNGGPSVPVLVDTGSTGLVIDPQYVGQQNLGAATGSGTGGYSGGLNYNYNTYTTTVDFGNGIVTAPTAVDVVSAESAQAFTDYIAPAGVVGVLGIGPNAGGPGPSIVTAALPGQLHDGVLLDQSQGYLIFGPNPLATRAAVFGAPYAQLAVMIGSGSLQTVSTTIDSGGVYGTIPTSIVSSVPIGTLISVYTSDGQTLLYSYTVDATNTPSIGGSTAMNTGNVPFAQGPVYIGYSSFGPIGATAFDYV
jgi:hypothetical protein